MSSESNGPGGSSFGIYGLRKSASSLPESLLESLSLELESESDELDDEDELSLLLETDT